MKRIPGTGEKLTGSATLGQADEYQTGTARTEAEQQCNRTNIMQEQPGQRLITGTADNSRHEQPQQRLITGTADE